MKIFGKFDYDFQNIFNKYDINIKNSNLELIMNGSFKNNIFVNNRFNLNTKKKSFIGINGYNFKNINAKLIFNGNLKDKLDLEIINFSFISEKDNFYEINNLASTLNFNLNKINLFADSISLDTSKIIDDYNLKTKFDFNFSGTINNLKLSLHLNDIKKITFFQEIF